MTREGKRPNWRAPGGDKYAKAIVGLLTLIRDAAPTRYAEAETVVFEALGTSYLLMPLRKDLSRGQTSVRSA